MTIPPKNIEVGKCYLTEARSSLQICQVTEIAPDGRLGYRYRNLDKIAPVRSQWRLARTSLELFAAAVQREVRCDWTPETDPQERGAK